MGGLKKIPAWISSGIGSTSKADEWFKNYTPAEQEMFLSLSQSGHKPEDINHFLHTQFWPYEGMGIEGLAPIQKIKKQVNEDLEMGDINLIGDQRVTTADNLYKTQRQTDLDAVIAGTMPVKDFKSKYMKTDYFSTADRNYAAQTLGLEPNKVSERTLKPIVSMSETKKAQYQAGVYDDPKIKENISKGTSKAKRDAANKILGMLEYNPDMATATFIDNITDPAVKNLVKKEYPELYTGKKQNFKTKYEEKAFKAGIKKLDPNYQYDRGHLIQMGLKDLFKGDDVEFPKFPTENTLNNFHDNLNSFINNAQTKRKDLIEAGDFEQVKVIDGNIEEVKSMVTDLLLESPIKGQKKTDIISPYPEGATMQVKMNIFMEKLPDALSKYPKIKEKFKKLRADTGLKRGGFVPKMSYGGDTSQYSSKDAEDYVQLAMLKGNPFKIKKPPEIVTDFDTNIKITDQGPGKTKIKETEQLKIGPADQKSIFYLKSDEVLANATQNKMQPSQWLGYLQKNGVSPTELDEFGLQNVIYNLGDYNPSTKKFNNNKAISKNDLITAYKKEKPQLTYKINQVEPFEKGLTDFRLFIGHSDKYSNQTDIEKIRSLKNKPADLGGNDLRVKLSAILDNSEYKSWDDMSKDIQFVINDTYKKYYGIDNVIKNGVGDEVVPFYSKNILDRFKRLKGGEGFYFSKDNVRHSGAQFLAGGTGYIEIPFTYNPQKGSKRASEPKYTYGEGHFTNTEGNNPVFWLRASERVDESGRRLLFIEEIQSDMHQKVKQNPDTFSYAKRHDSPGMINSNMVLDQINNLKVELGKVTDQIDKITGHTDPSATTIMERLKVKRESIRNQITELSNSIQDAAKKDDSVFPEGPFKKSENQAKVALKTAIKLAKEEGFDGVAIITGKAKNAGANASGKNAKGNLGFYDNIASKAAKNVAKNLDLDFSATNIKDGNGNTWAKIPLIELNKLTETKPTDMYKNTGGYIHYPSFVDVVSPL